MFYNSRLIAFAAAVAVTGTGLFVMASPVSARTSPIFVLAPSDVVVRHIGYADLNLASAAGEKVLKRRVGLGIDSLCNEVTGDSWPGSSPDYYKCSNDAQAQAKPQVSLAIQRAREIAATGTSLLAASAITIHLSD